MIRFYLRVFGSALLAILCTAAAASGPKGALSQQDIARHGQLLSIASQQGRAKVIIEFRNFQLNEGELSSASGLSTHANALRAVQDRVIERLRVTRALRPAGTPMTANAIGRFSVFPGIALTVNADDLRHLLADPDVLRVYEDVPEPPSLSGSGPLLGMSGGAFSGFSGTDQAVAVLDTGVEKSHTYLNGTVVSEACFSTTDPYYPATTVCPGGASETTATGSGVNCSSSVSGCGHGTHVAGIVASQLSGNSGIAKSSKIVAIQVFSRFDSSAYCTTSPCVLAFTSDQIKGLERAYALRSSHKLAAVNMSLGGGQFFSHCDTDPRKPIIDLLRASGVATVIASGNSYYTDSMGAPGCISSAISVGATTKTDYVDNYSNSATFLNLLAPGSNINSTVPGGGFQSWNGTSMATPHVAAGFAILKDVDPTASVDTMYSTLLSMGDPIVDSRNGISKQRIHLGRAAAAMDVRTRLANGTPIFGNGAAGSTPRYLSVVVPTGATNLSISTSGGTGDPTLYVRHATRPTTAVYTCRSANVGSSEFCSFPSPSAGTYHIMLHSPSAFSDVRVDANYDFNCSGSSIVTLGSLYNSTSEVTTCAPIHSSSTTTEATATAVLQLNSGDGIVLKPGFKVRRGGRLWARVYN